MKPIMMAGIFVLFVCVIVAVLFATGVLGKKKDDDSGSGGDSTPDDSGSGGDSTSDDTDCPAGQNLTDGVCKSASPTPPPTPPPACASGSYMFKGSCKEPNKPCEMYNDGKMTGTTVVENGAMKCVFAGNACTGGAWALNNGSMICKKGDTCVLTDKTYAQGARCDPATSRQTPNWCCSEYGRSKGYTWKMP
jgi:hypothetical protein